MLKYFVTRTLIRVNYKTYKHLNYKLNIQNHIFAILWKTLALLYI